MTYYFIKEGDNEAGPFTIRQLHLKSIKKDTPVWYAGIDDWIKAEQIYELKELFGTKKSSNFFLKNKIAKMWRNRWLKPHPKKVSLQVIINKEK